MICCEISGGLGNQFFRYAFARALQESRKTNGQNDVLYINYGAIDHHGFLGDLSDFALTEHKDFFCRRLLLKKGTLWQIILYFFITKICRFLSSEQVYKVLGKNGIVISQNPDCETLFLPSTNHRKVFTIGSFENEKYISSIKELLFREFVPKHDVLSRNKDLYETILSTNSICLAIRRGDFMEDEYKKTFYVCDLSYYKNAIKIIRERVEHPVFVVFSNDIKWVKENLEIEGDVLWEFEDNPVWETFRLMYSCKHFIISNSTLHWWAQYKGEYSDKIVISPDRWYNAPGWENHLLLDYFIKIPTGVENPYKKK